MRDWLRFPITNLLEIVGGLYGNQRDYLCCRDCSKEVPDNEWHVKTCDVCGGEITMVIPNSELLPLRWQTWHIKYFPHRYYTWKREGGDVKVWAWRGQKLRVTPYKMDWGGDDEDDGPHAVE